MKKLIFALTLLSSAAYADTDITVYRSPSCSCCGRWLAHLQDHHFNVKDILTDDMQAIKAKYGVSAALSSCHTALVNGYVIEGHVPASDIDRLLKTKAAVVGLTVPAMPRGTPGMEMGEVKDEYDVLSFDKNQQTKIFQHYAGNAQ